MFDYFKEKNENVNEIMFIVMFSQIEPVMGNGRKELHNCCYVKNLRNTKGSFLLLYLSIVHFTHLAVTTILL